MSATHRSRRSFRTVVSLSAAGAMALAMLPAGVTAQETDARTTNPPCDGDYDSTFDDIDGSAHENEVLCMADLGLTEGTSTSGGDSYAPRRDVTRAQMASFVARFIERYNDEELEEGDDERFDDVDSTFVHSENINKLANIDVVEGTSSSGGDSFAPQARVTRAQMASFIRRALSFLDDGSVNPLTAPPASDEDYFDDDDGSVHEANINAIADVGIVQGFADGDYRPGISVKRDTMASFVMRSFNYAIEENLGAEDEVVTFSDVELSWFDEVSTPAGESFGAGDVFATGDAGEAGKNGADGSADVTVDTEANSVTFTVEYSEVTGPFGDAPGLHIHEGARDENGPVVVFLATGAELDANAEDGVITGTVEVDRADFDVRDIIDDPEDYYLNLHSDDFPAGAIRGQLPDGPPSIADEDVTSRWTVEADPEQVTAEGGGEAGAEATFDLVFDSTNNVVCYEITSDGISGDYQSPAHTSTHIHEAEAGQNGPPRVAFRNPVATDANDLDGERTSTGCHSLPQETNTGDPDNGVGFELAEIEADPTSYYVDIHTEAHPAGAVRGQFRERAQVETEVQLNWQNEVGDVDGAQFPDGFTGERAQASFDADGVDADVFFGDVDDTAATGLADDGNGALTLRWNADEDFGNVFLEVTGTLTVTSDLADDVFGGNPIHIHEGDLAVNGPVDLAFATPDDVEVLAELGGDRQLLRYTIDQTLRPDELAGLADVLAEIEADMAAADEVGDAIPYYVNVHTEANLPGELRGHLQAVNLLAGDVAESDGARSLLPPVFKEVGVEAGPLAGSLVTLTFDVGVNDVDLFSSEDFRVEVDGSEVAVVTAAALGGEVQLTIDEVVGDGAIVEVTVLDGSATSITSDERDGSAENSVRVRATTAG